MTKELEALERILSYVKLDEYDYETRGVGDAERLIRKALTPPTEDDVSKALCEYFQEYGDFIYGEKEKWFTRQNRVVIWQTAGNDLHLCINLPPHLITMIGKFYESLEGEKWNENTII